jgi:hypothetical protein
MASPLITDVTPQGLQLRPIQGPSVRAQTQIPTGPLDPRYPMAANAAVFDALRLKEQQHQYDQELSLRLQENQQKLFKDMFGQSIQSSQIAGENYGLDPMLNSHALKLQQIKQKEQEAMANIQNSFSAATSRSGRPSATGYMDQINRTANALQQDLLSDQEYAQMALQNRRKDAFLKQVAALEKQGYNINYADVNQAVESYYNSANDLSGQTLFNTNSFDPQQYIFDKDQADKSLDEYLTGAIGETELERIVSAVELDPSLEGVNAYVTVNETVRNELGKASSLAANAILADPNLVRSMKAQGYDTTRAGVEDYVKKTLEDKLAKRDIERSYTNLGDVNTYLRAQQASQSKMDLEELQSQNKLELERERQRTKGTESTVNIRGNRGAIDREKEPEFADFVDYVDSQVDSQWAVSNQQSRDLKADLENLGISASSADIKVKDDGTVTLSYENKAGEVKTKTYGKASKASSSRGKADYTNLDPNSLGIDTSVIQGFEASRPASGVSSRADSNGIYSTRTEPFGGTSYGQHQLYGATWNGFVDYLDSTYDLGLSSGQKKNLDATVDGNKSNILDFIETMSSKTGEDSWVGLEAQYLTGEKYLPAIEHAEKVFGAPMSSQLRTYIADAANQHGQVNSGIIDKAKEILDSNPDLSSDNQGDILFAMNEARKQYLNQFRKRLGDSTVDSILANRYDPLYKGLSQNLNSSGADFNFQNAASPGQLANTQPPKPQPLTFTEAIVAAPQEVSPEAYYTQVNDKLKKRTNTYGSVLGGSAMGGGANRYSYGNLSEGSIATIKNYEEAVSDLEKSEETLEGVKEAQANLAIAQQQLMENREIATSLILSETSKEKLQAVGTELADNLLNDNNSVGYNRPIMANDGTQHSLQVIPLSGGKIGIKILTPKGEEKTEKFGSRSEFGDYLAKNYQPMLSEYLIESLKTSAGKKLGMQSPQEGGGLDLDAIRQRRNQFKAKGTPGGQSFFGASTPDTKQTSTVSTAQRVLNNDVPDNLNINISDKSGNKYDLEFEQITGGKIELKLQSGAGDINKTFNNRQEAIKFLEDNYQVTFSPN